jgi:hypothetical protein
MDGDGPQMGAHASQIGEHESHIGWKNFLELNGQWV